MSTGPPARAVTTACSSSRIRAFAASLACASSAAADTAVSAAVAASPAASRNWRVPVSWPPARSWASRRRPAARSRSPRRGRPLARLADLAGLERQGVPLGRALGRRGGGRRRRLLRRSARRAGWLRGHGVKVPHLGPLRNRGAGCPINRLLSDDDLRSRVLGHGNDDARQSLERDRYRSIASALDRLANGPSWRIAGAIP